MRRPVRGLGEAEDERPIVAENGGSLYLWMPMSEDGALKPRKENSNMPKKPETSCAGSEPMDFDAALAEMGDIRREIKALSARAASACAAMRSHRTDLRRREKAVRRTLEGLDRLRGQAD